MSPGQPLLEIHFLYLGDPKGSSVKHWYHVPRVGEYIELRDQPEGTVRWIEWHDDYIEIGYVDD